MARGRHDSDRPAYHDATPRGVQSTNRVSTNRPAVLSKGRHGSEPRSHSPDGKVGTADGEPGYMFGRDESHVLGLLIQHPYVRDEVQRELVQAGFYTQSGRAFRRTARGSPSLKRAPMLCGGGSSGRPMGRGCARCCLTSVGRRPRGRMVVASRVAWAQPGMTERRR